jgi:lactate permease
MNIPLILSIAPFAVFLILLLWHKKSLLQTSVITLFVTAFLAYFYWKIFPDFLTSSIIKGLLVAFDIFIIILGAIFFLEVIKGIKIIESISYHLETFSKDLRVQVIILAWLFESFLEGTAGFGVPAAVVAPLLIGLGIKPIKAIIIGLLGNGAPGIFGAAGTPIRIGFEGLDVSGVAQTAVIINLIGIIVPVAMLWILVSGTQNRNKNFFEALPFAIWSGIAFLVPSIFVLPLGQEFPSIIGPAIGMALVITTSKLGIFIPKHIMKASETPKQKSKISFFRSVLPYTILIILLVSGKFLLSGITIPIKFGEVSHAFNLFNPGFAFILSAIIVKLFSKNKKETLSESFGESVKRALEPFIVIACMSAFVQIMIFAGQNQTGYQSPILLISKMFETNLLPFWAPFVGAFGGFLTGSVTISNIMFGNFLSTAAFALQITHVKILALSLVGGAAGNMIGLADILSAESVVGLKNKEREVLKGVIVTCLIYVILTGIVGLIIV